ncbi:Transketolase-like pyrimidine-binding domain, partial [Trinorchestia longiramus]
VGFTTEASGRASDIALAGRVPVIRVNGEKPEAVSRAARLAVRYQQRFGRDVFVDVLCWRRHGHNELDNPLLTNPRMYSVIDAKTSIPDQYTGVLMEAGVITETEVAEIRQTATNKLARAYEEAQAYTPDPSDVLVQWDGLSQCPQSTVEVWDTGVSTETLKLVAAKSVDIPHDFNLHRHLQKTHVAARLNRMSKVPCTVDWATAEAMAFGSLLLQGMGVRLCGQDVGRGTFAQRHLQLVDQVSEARYLPLNHLSDNQTAFLEVANSILSEEAVLGFEYGMSINCKDVLHIWEAQFGDFFNGAQTIIDTFVSSGETKWLYQSGLVLLLPHGYDGAGPEHSSCRLERFLTDSHSADHIADSSASNWAVVAPTTPAQYFHLLRQQVSGVPQLLCSISICSANR